METKKAFRFFSINQHKDEEAYLRRMHQEGWKFVKVNWLGLYHFVKCEPEDVIYQLDYNKEGVANKSEYIQMFADCGWEYLQEFYGFTYFRKRAAEMNGEEAIFSDEGSQLAMMERIYKGRLLPLVIIFSCIIVPQLVQQLLLGNRGMAIFFGVMLALYLAIFIGAAIRYYRLKNKE